MSKYLFLFTIMPVQTFIAQARKTRDLYNGSRLLTDLIKYALKEIEPFEPIFPAKGLDSYPNRFVAIIEAENDDEMRKYGNNLKSKVQSKFEELSLCAAKETNVNVQNLPKSFYEQIKKHLSIQWVAIPYSEENYNQQYIEIESLLGATKNVRNFEQLEETGRKCSICGERNTIFYQNGNNSKFELKPNWDLLTEEEKKIITEYNQSLIGIHQPLESSEGLCAVCFTKRFYQNKEFPSTAEIALKDSINKLLKDNVFSEKIKKYKDIFGGDFDYQLFFDHNLSEKYFKKQNISPSLVKKAKENLYKIIEHKPSNIKLTTYYALIMFDGDSMGKWLSGTNLKEGTNLYEFHKNLTEALGNFAEETKKIVTDEKGKIVYAGGEDFLAFINLNYLFDVLITLREKFDELVNQKITCKKENANLSFSAGIIIAYYKTPLSEVIHWARKLEKDAKDIDDDKNGLAIAVLKHSGEINKTIIKWSYDNSIAKSIQTIKEITNYLAADFINNKFIKNIIEEFRRFPPKKQQDDLINDMMKIELKRLIKNSISNKSLNEEEKLKISNNLTNKLMLFYENIKEIDSFFSLLNISDFIARQLNGGK